MPKEPSFNKTHRDLSRRLLPLALRVRLTPENLAIHDPELHAEIQRRFAGRGGVEQAFALAGFDLSKMPRRSPEPPAAPAINYPAEDLWKASGVRGKTPEQLAAQKQFLTHWLQSHLHAGRPPSEADLSALSEQDRLMAQRVKLLHSHSWKKGVEALLGQKHAELMRVPRRTAAIAWLKERATAGKPIDHKALKAGTDEERGMYKQGIRLFGSLDKFCAAAEVKKTSRTNTTWSPEQIEAAFKRLASRPGQNLSYGAVKAHPDPEVRHLFRKKSAHWGEFVRQQGVDYEAHVRSWTATHVKGGAPKNREWLLAEIARRARAGEGLNPKTHGKDLHAAARRHFPVEKTPGKPAERTSEAYRRAVEAANREHGLALDYDRDVLKMRRYSLDEIVEELRRWHASSENRFPSDLFRDNIALYARASYRFGSLEEAFKRARLPYVSFFDVERSNLKDPERFAARYLGFAAEIGRFPTWTDVFGRQKPASSEFITGLNWAINFHGGFKKVRERFAHVNLADPDQREKLMQAARSVSTNEAIAGERERLEKEIMARIAEEERLEQAAKAAAEKRTAAPARPVAPKPVSKPIPLEIPGAPKTANLSDPNVRLVLLHRAGDAKALDLLVRNNLRFIQKQAARYSGRGLEFEDLVQEGTMGLLRATQTFDPARGLTFLTYADNWINQFMGRAIANTGRTIRIPVHAFNSRNKVMKARSSLFEELGREPTDEEVAAKTDLSGKQVAKILSLPFTTSLQKKIGEDGDTELGDLVAQIPAGERTPQESAVEAAELGRVLGLAVEGIAGRGRTAERNMAIFKEYLLSAKLMGAVGDENLTLQSLAEKHGLTRERVRQIFESMRAKVIHKIRTQYPDLLNYLKDF